MRMEPLPKFDVTLSVSRTGDGDASHALVKELVCKVKPEWDSESVEAKLLAGGHVNAIVKVWPADGGDEDAVIVKVLSPNSRVRQETETMVTVMRIAEYGGVAAPVLAEFNNGVVYKFTVGEMLNPDIIPHDNHVQGLIAKQLAKFHSINPDLYLDDPSVLPREPRTFKDIYHFLEVIPEDFSELYWEESKPAMTREEFCEELHWVESELKGPDGKIDDEVAFCHSDCWWSNQIYNKDQDSVRLIDFDFCNYNYVTREIVNYFMHGRMELIPNTVFRMHMFRESEKAAFIKVYLEERDRLRGGQGDACQTDIDRLIEVAKPMELVMVLDRLAVCLILNNHDYPVDYIWIVNQHWDHYQGLKKEYLKRKAAKSP